MTWRDIHKSNIYMSRIKKHNPGNMLGTIKSKTPEESILIEKLKEEAIVLRIHVRDLVIKILKKRYKKYL